MIHYLALATSPAVIGQHVNLKILSKVQEHFECQLSPLVCKFLPNCLNKWVNIRDHEKPVELKTVVYVTDDNLTFRVTIRVELKQVVSIAKLRVVFQDITETQINGSKCMYE